MNHRIRLAVTPLEARRVPAVTVINPTTAAYTDVDGDQVTVRVSAGTLTAGLFTTVAAGAGDQLQAINLSGGGFDHAALAVTVRPAPTGDGRANIGLIDSTGHDLGAVTIPGDLGRIVAGDGDPAATAVSAVRVRSLGRLGTDTQAAGGTLESDVAGGVGTLTVTADVVDAFINVHGSIGSISIGGSLIGGPSTNSGRISGTTVGPVRVTGDILGGAGDRSGSVAGTTLGTVTVGGRLVGGAGNASGLVSGNQVGVVTIRQDVWGGPGSNSGVIDSSGSLAGVTVRGSVIGGSGPNSGQVVDFRINPFVAAGPLGPVRIGRDLVGGAGTDSGQILADSKLTALTIGGSVVGGAGPGSGLVRGSESGRIQLGGDLRGGTGAQSGAILVTSIAGLGIGGSVVGGPASLTGLVSVGDAGPIAIGRDLVGAGITGTAPSLAGSGEVLSTGRIASVTIGGSVITGIDTSTGGNLTSNATIRAADDIGTLTVRGSLVGHVTDDGASPVVISARGRHAVPTGATADVAIGRLTVGGRVESAEILAGYDTALRPTNADAQVGPVSVGGDWIASTLAAGVDAGGDGLFGTADDVKISGANTTDDGGIVSRVAAVTVRGQVLGTPASVNGADHFGFVAQELGVIVVGRRGLPLTTGAANDLVAVPIGSTGDVAALEVGL